ncbi:hypothetical protein Taro_031010 [Colocasia esculenta]|uniref:Uncharacterized protein n=1 Tax=Colocasia esculenta TaxID=4460 RepID=A0A843VTH6_COLES|nr:hypothetical protein [Colocasia esculenta]
MVSVLFGVFRVLWPCRVCRRWPTALLGVSRRGVVRACAYWACLGYKPAVSISVGCCPACSLSPDALHLRACPVQRLSPFPGTPILGILLREFSELRASLGFVGLASWALFSGFRSAGSLGCLVLTSTAVSVTRSLVPSVVAL